MRLIDADALLEKKYINEGKNTVGVRRWIAFSEIEDAPTASPWHRVEDVMPHGQELVIVAVKDTAGDTPFWYTACGWVTTDGEYWIVDNEICDYVVAWMPLPEPPKEGVE